MNERRGLRVLSIAGFGPIVRGQAARQRFYGEDLGVQFKEEPGGYQQTEPVAGAKAFCAVAALAGGRIVRPHPGVAVRDPRTAGCAVIACWCATKPSRGGNR